MAKGRPKKGVVSPEDYELIRELYLEQGFSLRELSVRFFVTTHEIGLVLKALGVVIRKRGRPKKVNILEAAYEHLVEENKELNSLLNSETEPTSEEIVNGN